MDVTRYLFAQLHFVYVSKKRDLDECCLFIELDPRCFSMYVKRDSSSFFFIDPVQRNIEENSTNSVFKIPSISTFRILSCILLSYYIRAIKPWKIKT